MHQYLFFIGDFPIRAYGVMLALAIISGASVAYFLLKKDGGTNTLLISLLQSL